MPDEVNPMPTHVTRPVPTRLGNTPTLHVLTMAADMLDEAAQRLGFTIDMPVVASKLRSLAEELNTRAPSTLPDGWRERVARLVDGPAFKPLAEHIADAKGYSRRLSLSEIGNGEIGLANYNSLEPRRKSALSKADAIGEVFGGLGSVACSAEPSLASRVSDAGSATPSEGITEAWIVNDEEGGPVGLLVERADGLQVWSGEASDHILGELDDDERSEVAGGSHLIVVASNDGSTPIILGNAVSVDAGMTIVRAIAATHSPLKSAQRALDAREGETGEANKPTEHKDSPIPSEKTP